jgi:deoxyribonuclease V
MVKFKKQVTSGPGKARGKVFSLKKGIDHPWDVDVKTALKIQERLRKQTAAAPFSPSRFLVAGIDVSYRRDRREASAAAVVMAYPQMAIREVAFARREVSFPYVPGLLAFREIPAILKAWDRLKSRPDLVILDGHGTAHPRRFGLACHLGLLLDRPSIGCAKSHYYGSYQEPPGEKGAYSYVLDPQDGERIGAVLRSRANVACLFVSPGHLTDLPSAIKVIFSLVQRCRLPEPARLAHSYSTKGWE